jgi:Zn-dependent protease with chaperone function
LQLRHPDTAVLISRQPRRQVQWPERTRHGARIAQLPDGGSLHALNPSDWDRWFEQAGHQHSWVVRSQLSWRATLVALVLLVLSMGAAYQWGLPALTQTSLLLIPRSVDQGIGEAAWPSLDEQWFKPTALPQPTRQRIEQTFARATRHAQSRGVLDADVQVKLVFRQSRIGPNALALPDGTIILTDELVTLLDGQDAVLIGVLAHEWGHVQRRHAMRMLIQASAIGAVATLVVGDFSQMLATAPALLGQMAYSRDAEREADETAIAVLQANGIAPKVMVALFDQLDAYRQSHHGKQASDAGDTLGMALSSHPSDAERRARFSNAR